MDVSYIRLNYVTSLPPETLTVFTVIFTQSVASFVIFKKPVCLKKINNLPIVSRTTEKSIENQVQIIEIFSSFYEYRVNS